MNEAFLATKNIGEIAKEFNFDLKLGRFTCFFASCFQVET